MLSADPKGIFDMRIAKIMLALAASSMTVAPAMAASANPAASLSVAKSVRTGSPTGADSKLAGGFGGLGVLGAVILAGVAAIVVIAVVQNDDDDTPDSP